MVPQLKTFSQVFLYLRIALIVVEIAFSIRKQLRTRSADGDLWTNLVCGAAALLVLRSAAGAFAFSLFLGVASLAPAQHEFSWALLALSIFGADLGFYLYHRLAHTVGLLWADHSVHHSSRELDLTTNLRNSAVVALYSWLTVAPLLLLGVDPAIVLFSHALVNDYPFFLHTTKVRKLPSPVEWLLNTPSHHRVHHAINDHYLNKNFAGIFIIWDRLFGSFAEEDANEPCEFGTVRPVNTRNPIKVLFAGWYELLHNLSEARGFSGKVRALLRVEN